MPVSKWKVIRRCVPRNEITQPVNTRDPKEVVDEFINFFVLVGVEASYASKSLIELRNLPPPADTTKALEIHSKQINSNFTQSLYS